MKLTDRSKAPSLNLTSHIIHVVNTGDTSQSPQGSSYYTKLNDIFNLVNYSSITGGTISGNTLILNNSTGGTISISGITSSGNSSPDTYITGGTYSNGSLTFVNNTGGTFTVTGFSTGSSSSDTYITGGTPNNSTKQYTFVNNTGGTFNVVGLTDLYITGGTYSNGILILVNNTGGTISITGLTASAVTSQDIYVTGATTNDSSKQYTFTNITGGTFVVNGLTDLTITGGTYSSGILLLNNNTGGTVSITGFSTGSTVFDSQIIFNDNTINNVSINKHGFVPKLPNDATVYLDGTGNYTTPSGIYTVGTIINEPCNSLSAWTQTGSEFSLSGGKYSISSSVGTTSFGSYIRQTQYGTSDLENTTITAELTVGNITTTSFGVGIGYYSQQATFKKSLTIGFLMDSVNKGRIAFYFDNLTTGAVISPNAINISSGDVTTVKIRQIKNNFIVTWSNGAQSITHTYTYFLNNTTLNPTIVTNMPNVYNYSIYALGGGTHYIDNFVVKSDEKKFPAFLFVGDSLIKGYNLGTISRRAIDVIAESAQLNISSLANGGNYASDINISEGVSFSANTVIFSLGINDLSNAVSVSALMAKYATVLSGFTAAGYVLGSTFFFTTLRPYFGFDVTTANAQIRSTYPSGYIELYYPFAASGTTSMNSAYASADGLHLNEYGAMLEASIYMNFFDLKTKNNINFNNRGIFSDQQGRVAIGVGNIARYPLDIIGSTSQLRLGGTANDNGAFLGSFNSDGLEMYGGLLFNGTNYTIKATNYAGLSTFAGDVYFWGAKTTTIGNTIASPAATGLLTANGRLYLGGAVTPTATIHLKASTGAINTGPIKLTNGTQLATPEPLVIEPETGGANLLFTNNSGVRGRIVVSIQSVVSAMTATTIDWSTSHQFVTLSANTIFNFSNTGNAKTIIVAVQNTGSFTLTWPTVDWGSAGAPVQRTGTVTDIYTLTQINNLIFGSVRQ